MRRAGEVVRATQGVAVVRTPGDGSAPTSGSGASGESGGSGASGGSAGGSDPPSIGTELVDESLSAVGEVVDVFGPVDRPYLAVKPAARDPATMLGDRLYER